MASQVSIRELFHAYSMSAAICLRMHFFLEKMMTFCGNTFEANIVDTARRSITSGGFDTRVLESSFSRLAVKEAVDFSLKVCLYHAAERCVGDEEMGVCSVCLEARSNYYLIHGNTAHKCVCAVCAMTIAVNKGPKCPICRQTVAMAADTAPISVDCVCSDPGCTSLLVVDASIDRIRTRAECATCTLESFEHTACMMVYTLFK